MKTHEDKTEWLYAVIKAKVASNSHNILIRFNYDWILPLTHSLPFMMEGVIAWCSDPYTGDNCVVARVGNLHVDSVVWLIKVQLVGYRIHNHIRVDILLENWSWEAICEGKTNALHVLTAVAFHD